MSQYAPIAERNERKRTIKALEEARADPVSWASVSNKHDFQTELSTEKKVLESRTPPPVGVDDKTKLERRAGLLQEAIVNGAPKSGIEPMPSLRQMREAPTGAVGQCLRWNNFIKNYTLSSDGRIRRKRSDEQGLVDEWKDARRRLFQDVEEDYRDICSVETIRPEDHTGESKFINYARMSFAPGKNMSKEEWNEATGHESSEREQAILELADSATTKAPSFEQLYATGERLPEKCLATTAEGHRCSRRASAGGYCGLHRNLGD